MTETTPPELASEVDQWRESLVRRGFGDDGRRLRGEVHWTHPTDGQVTARIEVIPSEAFPFAPPAVRVLDPGAELTFTFHVEPEMQGAPGNLCLWDTDWPYERAPWRNIDQLLEKVRGWLEQTAAGWPGDNDCDLERYLGHQDLLLLYDGDSMLGQPGAYRTREVRDGKVIEVIGERRSVDRPRTSRKPSRRKDRGLAWITDVGELNRPLQCWADIHDVLGAAAEAVTSLIYSGTVRYLLLRYQRGDRTAAIALHVTGGAGEVEVKSCESADVSLATRQLRAGPLARELGTVRVAVVGVGAVGSFAADLLFRSGVRHLTLIDSERLRPGNLVRHLAGDYEVGQYKVMAVLNRLQQTGLPASDVTPRAERLYRLREAIALVRDHEVVLDATANARVTSLLAIAAQAVGPGMGHAVITACVQRSGHVVRVDRFPLRPGEAHLPALEYDEHDELRERGCGSPVSGTPPTSVLLAAGLAVRFVVDQATRECALPASMADVLQPQLEPPFGILGYVAANDQEDEA